MPTRSRSRCATRAGAVRGRPEHGARDGLRRPLSNQGGSPVETILAALGGVLGDGRHLDRGQEAPGGRALPAPRAGHPARRVPADLHADRRRPRGRRARPVRGGAAPVASSCRRRSTARSTRWSRPGATDVHHRYRIGRPARRRTRPRARSSRPGRTPGPTSWPISRGSAVDDRLRGKRPVRAAGRGRGSRCASRSTGPTSAGSTAGSRGSSRSPRALSADPRRRGRDPSRASWRPSAKATSDRISAMLPSVWAKRGGYSCSGSTLGRGRRPAIRRQIDAVDRVLETERGADPIDRRASGDEPDRAGQERDDQQDGRDARLRTDARAGRSSAPSGAARRRRRGWRSASDRSPGDAELRDAEPDDTRARVEHDAR